MLGSTDGGVGRLAGAGGRERRWPTMTSTTAVPKRNATSKPQLTPTERAANGRDARTKVPRPATPLGSAVGPARSRRDPRGASSFPRRRAGADPVRPDARLAVRFLPRRRGDHGLRSGGHADHRDPRPGLRRRAHLELRRLRLARAFAAVRRQRLRRDRSGPVGMGREAAGRQHRDRRTRQRLLGCGARGACATRRRSYRSAMARSPRCAISTSGTRGSRSRTACRRSARTWTSGTPRWRRRSSTRRERRTACRHSRR